VFIFVDILRRKPLGKKKKINLLSEVDGSSEYTRVDGAGQLRELSEISPAIPTMIFPAFSAYLPIVQHYDLITVC